MAQILVAKGFTLTLDGGERHRFEPGVHEVEEAIAGHWFVRAHLAGEGSQPPPEHVVEARIADSEAVTAALAEAAAQLEVARTRIEDLEAQVAGMVPRTDLEAARARIAELESMLEVATAPATTAGELTPEPAAEGNAAPAGKARK